MKIIKLQSQNFKRLKAISIEPKGNTVIVSGKNGQGKSSILDSIFVALAGKDKDLLKPIRDGETKAEITVETEGYFIKRLFKQGRTELEVISKDGEIMSKPQTFLDSVVGKLSFDPLEFASLKASEQRELLLKLTNIDLGKFTVERKKLYDERHDIGVLRDSLADPIMDEVAQAEMKVKEGKVEISTLTQEMQKQQDAILEYQKKLLDKNEAEKQAQRLKQQIADLEAQIVNLQNHITEYRSKLVKANEAILSMEGVVAPEVDLPSLQEKMDNAQTHNLAVDRAASVLEAYNKRKVYQAKYDEFSFKIENLDLEKSKALESAKMPIEGLSVTDEAVTYNKIPFHQLSSAEKLKVSMAIAMSMNPELRVIRILDGSLLDEDNMKVIEQMAKDQDYQVWVEVVDSSGKVGFYVEDGEIQNMNL